MMILWNDHLENDSSGYYKDNSAVIICYMLDSCIQNFNYVKV